MTKVLQFFVLLFFLHGVFYIFFPQFHYLVADTERTNHIQLIKYVVFAILFVILIITQRIILIKFSLSYLSLAIYCLCFALLSFIFNTSVLSFQVLFGVLAVPFYLFIKHYFGRLKVAKICYLIWFISIFFTYYSLVFSFGIDAYNATGTRSVGIFINPNLNGIMILLSSVVVLNNTKGKFYFAISTLVIIGALFATGSKTAIFLFGLFIIYRYKFLAVLASLCIAILVLIIVRSLDLYNFRKIELNSLVARLDSLTEYAENIAENSIYIFTGWTNSSIIDNVYLDLLSVSGIIFLFIFLYSQLITLIKLYRIDGRVLFDVFLFLCLSGLTTNFIRLWPLSIIFWLLVAHGTFVSKKHPV